MQKQSYRSKLFTNHLFYSKNYIKLNDLNNSQSIDDQHLLQYLHCITPPQTIHIPPALHSSPEFFPPQIERAADPGP